MKKFFFSVALMLLVVVSVFGQNVSALDRLKDDPRRAFATDYPYKQTDDVKLTKGTKGLQTFLYQSLCTSWLTLLLEHKLV